MEGWGLGVGVSGGVGLVEGMGSSWEGENDSGY